MKEIWKDIVGCEGIYQISNLGNVKSLSRIIINKNGSHCPVKEKILKPGKDKDGYLQVHLQVNKKGVTRKIHRLVALAFIENANNCPVINHKDENKQNNIVSNLEWCTNIYNVNYGTGPSRRSESMKGKPGLTGSKNPMYGRVGKLNPMYGRVGGLNPQAKKVVCLNNGKVFETIKEASKYANTSSIRSCLEGESSYCGKIDGVKLVWETYEKYVKMSDLDIKLKIEKSNIRKPRTKKRTV